MNYAILKNKFIVVDTDVLVNTSKYLKFYQEVFAKLAENEVVSLLDEFVRFEFLRKAKSNGELEELKAFLVKLLNNKGAADIKVSGDTIDIAMDIANLYSWKNIKNPSFTDCILAAHLKKFSKGTSGNLFLLTENHKDFPVFLFDRVGFETIDLGDSSESFHNLGFYSFNAGKFEKLLEEYKQ